MEQLVYILRSKPGAGLQPVRVSNTWQKQRFYVYVLCDGHCVPFYVGKGMGLRLFEHEREARGGCQCRKCNKIRAILASGQEITRLIVFTTSIEDEAYRHEYELICSLSHAGLVNRTLGGRGSRSLTNEQLAYNEAFVEWLDEQRETKKIECQTRAVTARWEQEQITEIQRKRREWETARMAEQQKRKEDHLAKVIERQRARWGNKGSQGVPRDQGRYNGDNR
jgi:hypothetical protein